MSRSPEPPPPLECRLSRWKLAGLLVLCLVLFAASWHATTRDGWLAKAAGWAGLALFGTCAAALPRAIVHAGRRAELVFSADGVEDRRTGFGRIPWDDVTHVTVHASHGTRLLAVHVGDPEAYLSRLTPARRRTATAHERLGYSPITFGFLGLTPGIDAVLDYLREIDVPIQAS